MFLRAFCCRICLQNRITCWSVTTHVFSLDNRWRRSWMLLLLQKQKHHVSNSIRFPPSCFPPAMFTQCRRIKCIADITSSEGKSIDLIAVTPSWYFLSNRDWIMAISCFKPAASLKIILFYTKGQCLTFNI